MFWQHPWSLEAHVSRNLTSHAVWQPKMSPAIAKCPPGGVGGWQGQAAKLPSVEYWFLEQKPIAQGEWKASERNVGWRWLLNSPAFNAVRSFPLLRYFPAKTNKIIPVIYWQCFLVPFLLILSPCFFCRTKSMFPCLSDTSLWWSKEDIN